MKFYSYEYLVGQVHAFSWLKAVVAAIVLIGVIVAIVRHNKDRYETKYRELIILGIIVILLIVGTTFGDYRSSVVVLDQKQAAIHFVENAAEQLETDKSHIYINTETSVDGAIIKVDDHFYRVIKGSGDKYLFEKLDLYQPDVELVEAK